MEQGESSGSSSTDQYERVYYSPYSEHQYCTAIRSIDTVRALHQTVVSLRTALEESRIEIEKLKKQILINTEIQDARHCQHTQQQAQQQQQQQSHQATNKNLQEQVDYKILGEKVAELEKIYYKAHPKGGGGNQETSEDSLPQKRPHEGILKNRETSPSKPNGKKSVSLAPDITISTQNLNDSNIVHSSSATGGSTNNQMASRIDVKIKVSSNINVTDNNDTSTDASESSDITNIDNKNEEDVDEMKNKKNDDEGGEKEESASCEKGAEKSNVNVLKRENPKVEVEMYEDSNTNTFNVDGKNLKIKVTSEENINVRKSIERISVQQSSTEYLNLDIDELSEGDNSVFTEGATTPIEQRLQQVEDVGSDNEADDNGELPREEEREEVDDLPEEVDDIELIFSSDDNKDMIQEDLVSISEYEPWQEAGGDGTPILTKFATITSDDLCREAYYEKKKALKAARVKARENAQGSKSLESTDSLSFDNNNQSVDYKLSSFEKDSSVENPISRDNSLDAFTSRPGTNVNQSSGGRKWTNVNVLIETDISKVGIGDENVIDMGRRNTCPNPPIYRPLGYSQNRSSFRSPLAAKYPRSPRNHNPLTATKSLKGTDTSTIGNNTSKNGDVKCNSAAQTDISALPHQWRSETHLTGTDVYGLGYTLPSKYNSPQANSRCGRKSSLRLSEKTQEARRVLLSDINFTSMVPELSRSADHLCQQKINEEEGDEDSEYFKGNLLKTPDYGRGITASTSTPGVSQWTVNESTTQTEGFWNNRGDSFDSSKSYSLKSGNSTSMLSKHHRSRSVPSIRCAICKQNHSTIKPSESMHYTKTVTFREPQKARGSLPDLRHDCHCPRRYGGGGGNTSKTALFRMHESSGSTESLLEEADEYLRHCTTTDDIGDSNKKCHRRCSEADIHRDYHPSKQSLPFLPKTPKCLKCGQLAKVIARGGRIVVGRIRYIGPIANNGEDENETYVGLQLPHALGECDGSFNGKKFFECESNYGIFVPYKKVVMAWN